MSSTANLQLRLAEQELVLVDERARRLAPDGRAREAQLLSELTLTINDALNLERKFHPIAAVARSLCGSDVVRIALATVRNTRRGRIRR